MHQPEVGEEVILVRRNEAAPDEHGDPVETRYAGIVTAVRDGGSVDIRVDDLLQSFPDIAHGGEGMLDDEFYLFPSDVEADDAEAAAANPPTDAFPASSVASQPHAMPGMEMLRPGALSGDDLAHWLDGFDAGFRACEQMSTETVGSVGESDASPDASPDAAGTGSAAPADAALSGEGEGQASPSAPAEEAAAANWRAATAHLA